MPDNDLPLIVIAGPTASGKTALAIELAEKYNGEIICADSRTVYKYMDIGTAKPSAGERARVPHWGLDLVEPGERFTAADFKNYAEQKISEIRARRRVPFLVGGTGLYVDAVIFNFQFGNQADDELRSQLAGWPIEKLQDYCNKNNIKLPENSRNKRYLIRAIERQSVSKNSDRSLIDNCIIVGISTNRDVLRTRIDVRSEQLFANGVVEEAILLGKKYGWTSEAMTGNIYKLVKAYLDNEIDYHQLKTKFATSDRRLAKRQVTWLKRNPHIMWLDLDEAQTYLSNALAKLN